MRLLVASVLVASSLAAHAEEEPLLRGRLCLRNPGNAAEVERCKEVEGVSFEVEPEAKDRVWIWYGADYKTLTLGNLAAGEGRIMLPQEPASILFELDGSFDRDWPQPATISVGKAGHPPLWTIDLADVTVTRLREIRVPRGSWAITFRANRHAPRSETLQKLTDEPVDLGEIDLEALPQIRGTVIDREAEALSEVMLIARDGSPLARSDFRGEFFFEAPCDSGAESCLLPEWFRLEYPETAPRWFQTLHRNRDVDLDVIRMAPGGTLDLRVKRNGAEGPIFVDVIDDPRPASPRPYYPTVASAPLKGGADSLIIEDLPEGMLRLAVRGLAANQYYSEYFVSSAGKTVELEVNLKPTTVTFEVFNGEKYAPGLRLDIEQHASPAHISQTEPTDARGRTSLTLWQPGDHTVRIIDPHRRGGRVFDPARVTDPVRIEVGRSSATGRVIDDDTAQPIVGATVFAETDLYQADLAPATVTDEDGEYELEDLMPAQHRLRVIREGYGSGGTRAAIRPGENRIETIRLEKTVPYTVTATWDDGRPVVGAAFIWPSSLHPPEPSGYTDENGRFRHGWVPPHDPVTFLIVPVEGSFAIGTLYRERDIEIEVQRPGKRVVLDFKDENGDPIDYAHVFFNINGSRSPSGLRRSLELIQYTKFQSGAATRLAIDGLAPGYYQFIAVRALSETEMLQYREWGKPTGVTVGPVEQSGTVEVRIPVIRCRGDRCFDH